MVGNYDLKKIIRFFAILVGAVLLVTVLFFRLYQFYTVLGDSMSPSLKNRKTYLMERGPLQPNRGDIIIFRNSGNRFDYVKRVVALEKEQIEIKRSMILVNGEPLLETYLGEQGEIPDFGPMRVPEGHVFVLGDDRVESVDSRSFGPVSIQSIKGKIVGSE